MRLRSFRWLTAALMLHAAALSSCLPIVEGPDYDLSGQQIRLTLLHTSDIHSRLLPFDFAPLKTDVDLGIIPEAAPFGGAARMASVLKRERARADRVLHLDSGDAFQGAPIFNRKTGEAEFRFLSLAGLSAAVIGNHEFDAGPINFTTQARDSADFPLLAANYIWENLPESNQTGQYTQPYALFNVKGVRVAVIGMANISSLNSIVEGGNSLQAVPLEQNEICRAYVDLLKPVTDLIVVVSHLGLHEDQDLIQGYEAFFEYGRIKSFVDREREPWKVMEWFGERGNEKSVVRVHIPGVRGLDIIQGGHLHIVLNPPQTLTDPGGRKVLLEHSGAFAKYVGRLDVVIQMPPKEGSPEGAEVLSHDFKVFPLDALWCDDEIRKYRASKFWDPAEFRMDPRVVATTERCATEEDRRTTDLLLPYVYDLDFSFGLTQIFAYAPRDVARRNNSSGGDSPLGNFAADSMRKRKRVEAEVALTNSLGIRDNIYAGPITQESMFNVFPFENTINIMYLSGSEMQELFDFVAERSASRGCQSQAQISGARFTMDCAQVQLNDLRMPCSSQKETGAANGSDCPKDDRTGRAPWQCLDDVNGGRCWAHPATDISISGKPIDLYGTYKIAVNDYIAKGGSGFAVLKRNTTRIETGISLRDSLIGYMQGFCNCTDLIEGRTTSRASEGSDTPVYCGNLIDGKYVVDDQALAYCQQAKAFKEFLDRPVEGAPASCRCREVLEKDPADVAACGFPAGDNLAALEPSCANAPAGPRLARCSCLQALKNDTAACGFITAQTRSFCEDPMTVSTVIGFEDGRIGRRVK